VAESATARVLPAAGPVGDWISVCVCTYKRPELLARLPDALVGQVTGGAFGFDVIVVDNDAGRSSAGAASAAAGAAARIVYDVEPERNISLARNRAVRHAGGNLVAFIDDDECPGPEWLARLHATLAASHADGVLGPVLPDFPAEAPAWLRHGRVFHRKRYVTGSHIGPGDARTGNVLMRRALFDEGGEWFDPSFGRTGGEDSDFFARQFRAGRTFVWCDEAVAYETVPRDRWTAAFHIRRLWRSGTISGERIRDGRLPSQLILRNAVAFGACAVAMPVSLLLPKHVWMRVAQKLAYCAGVLTACAGWSIFRERE